MSLTSLRNISSYYRRDDDIVDAAVDAFRAKEVPAYSKIEVRGFALEGRKIVVDAQWQGTRYSCTATIDPKTQKGEVIARMWIRPQMAEDKAALDKGSVRAILRIVQAGIDDATFPATRELRAALAVASRR